jgi:hypothetical protein
LFCFASLGVEVLSSLNLIKVLLKIVVLVQEPFVWMILT